MRERFTAPVLLILGLAIYSPVLPTGPFVLDDGAIIAHLRALNDLPFSGISLFGNGGTYYRPILMLSFLVDLHAWDLHPGGMHLFNILLHVGNALLVYLNVRVLYPRDHSTIRAFPFGAAVLFLVHPINTESINWIAGRTDPLAAFFSLSATYCILLSLQDLKRHRFWLAACLMLLGSLSKEVAFFCFPAAILFLLLYKHTRGQSSPCMNYGWRISAVLPFFLGGLTYFFLRTASFVHADKGIATVTAAKSYQSPLNVAKQLITDFGFYIKKLVIPYPLHLAIDQVHPNYFWAGVIVIILFAATMFMRNALMGMALLIGATIFPALLNALLHIAWTPYAERYLYIPAAFLCIAIALPKNSGKISFTKLQSIILLVLIGIYLPTTVGRNLLWADQLELTRLTHRQTPDNPTVWSMYAVMLANREFYDAARDEFKDVLKQYPEHLYTLDSLASMELYIGKPDAARDVLEVFFSNELEPDGNILQTMLECNRERLKLATEKDESSRIRTELIETYFMRYKAGHQFENLQQAAELAAHNSGDDTFKARLDELLENKLISSEIHTRASSRLSSLTQNDITP